MHKFAYLSSVAISISLIISCTNNEPINDHDSIESKFQIDSHHGFKHTDPLQYLELKDELGKPAEKTQLVIDEYNQQSEQFFADNDDRLEVIYKEIMSRRPKGDDVPPHTSRGITFTKKYKEGEIYPSIYYQRLGSSEKKLLIDEAARAEGQVDYQLNDYQLSPDNNLLAWVEDTQSGSMTTLYISRIENLENILHKIEVVGSDLVWGNESKRLYYSLVDPKDRRYYQIRMFNIETKEDIEIYTEADENFLTFVTSSAGSNGAFIQNINWSVNESLYIDFNKSYTDLETVVSRENEMTYSLGRYEDLYVISYQADEAMTKIATFTEPSIHIGSWSTLYSTKASISAAEQTKNHFVFVERAEGADNVKTLHVPTSKILDIHVSEDRYGANFILDSQDIHNDIVRIAYNTHVTNRAIIDVDLTSNNNIQAHAPTIPNFNPDDYIVEFKYAPSHDGVMVPATIIRRKDTPLPAPAYQYVYGAYGYGMSPRLSFFAFSLIDRGFVYVVSHVRGGNELGDQWHQGGRMLNRKNTFKDFQAISEYLIKEKYTTEGNISISGESAGGTVLAVAVNEKPHYYKSMTSLVPALDIFNKLLNPSLMITKTSWSEFGNPTEDKEVYEYIKSYSPIENTRAQNYPDYFITARLGDRNVDFFEPLKWAVTIDKIDTDVGLNLVSIESGDHIRTGYGGKEYDFAKQMLFILNAHGKNKQLL